MRRGGAGFVQEAVDTATGLHVAVKFIPRSAAGYDPTAVSGELLNQRLCAGHPNIIQLQVCTAFSVAHWFRKREAARSHATLSRCW